MKQATLFRAWKPALSKPPKPPDDDIVVVSDDDEFLVQAMDETLAAVKDSADIREDVTLAQGPLEQLPGFDIVAGRTWVYPTNYPVRDYQFSIVQASLFKNTLVILPTGLGKTFLAAVVMYNFYRWYPTGKIIFTAPTKPLVAQQIEACYKIMGIPLDDTMEMTGTLAAPQRAKAWRDRRVFFLTPQVMMNDLLRNALDPKDVKCLVIDEAHKALGNYAYCQVIQEIVKYTNQFRILALSATPGSDANAVRQVLSNLLISHVELRTEDSLDIQKYTQKRTIEKVVVPLSDEIVEVKHKFLSVVRVYLERLERHGALPRMNPESLGKFRVLKMKETFQRNPPMGLAPRLMGQLQGDFSLLISLYHAYELLMGHGLRSFFNFLKGVVDGEKSNPRVRYELMHNHGFEELYTSLDKRLGTSGNDANVTLRPSGTTLFQNSFHDSEDGGLHVIGHPKLSKLEEIVVDHFRSFSSDDQSTETRVMVFSQYRDSVKEITAQLNRHRPLVKAMNFVGQSQKSGPTKGFTQKQQLMVVRKFREGGYNVLVSTCVGEEGLDIGEIDLIVCYDAPKSPIRLVQRMGRTGRKREGRIVVLLTQGKEEQAYRESNFKKQRVHRAITDKSQLGDLYQGSPRMVPKGLNPVCHRMFMTVPEYHNAKAVSDRGTRPITGFLFPGKKGGTALTRQEQLYYEAHFEVSKSAAPGVPSTSSAFLTLQVPLLFQPEDANEEAAQHSHCLSLSSWTPWQNRLQPLRHLSHSPKTEAYVHVMQFIENLRLTDNELDAYGLEMKTFLRPEDVLSESHESDADSVASLDGIMRYFREDKHAQKAKGRKVKHPVNEMVRAGSLSKNSSAMPKKESSPPKDSGASPSGGMALDVAKDEGGIVKKKKKRMITDFFGDKSMLEDLSKQAVAHNDFIEVVECPEPLPQSSFSRGGPPTLEDLFRLSPSEEDFLGSAVELPRAEVHTPSNLDDDVLPSDGRPLSPVDVSRNVGLFALQHGYSCSHSVAPEPAERNENESLGRQCQDISPVKSTERKSLAIACQSTSPVPEVKARCITLELDSDLEDLFADTSVEDANKNYPLKDDQSPEESNKKEQPASKVSLEEEREKSPARTSSKSISSAPSHSTPKVVKHATARPASKVEPTRFATVSPEVFGQQSPIRCPEDCAAWNVLDDSDMELFQNCSDPEESDEGAAVTAGEDVLGMTEICDLIDDSEAWAEEPLLDPARKDKMAGLTSGVSEDDDGFRRRRGLSADKNKPEEAAGNQQDVSLTVAQPPGGQGNETTSWRRPTFELSIDLDDFDFGSSLEDPVETCAKDTTVNQCGEASTSIKKWKDSTYGRRSPSRPIPVAMVRPITSTQHRRPVEISSSDEGSPLRSRRKIARRKPLVSDSSTGSDISLLAKQTSGLGEVIGSSDDDFQRHDGKRKLSRSNIIQRSKNTSFARRVSSGEKPKGRTRAPVKKNKRKVSCFVEQEADVSLDIVHSSDESENSSLDNMDESFIDDQTQAHRASLYLHTVRSPLGLGRFKIGSRTKAQAVDVYSQAVSADEADYVQDSFCVGSSDSSALVSGGRSPTESEEEVVQSCITPQRARKMTRRRKRRIRVLLSEEDDNDVQYERSDDQPRASRRATASDTTSRVVNSASANGKHTMMPSASCLSDLPGSTASSEQPCGSSQQSQLSRQQRLHLQKLKQEEFRRKHLAEQLRNEHSMPSRNSGPSQPLRLDPELEMGRATLGCTVRTSARDQCGDSHKPGVTIIVDSQEIASGSALVSTLRATPAVNVHVHSLDAGSFLVGQRACVLRKGLSDFGNGQNHAQLQDEVRRLLDLYDRPWLILEKNQRNPKPGVRPFKRTKYFDATLMFLASTHVRLLFSSSQETTAELVVCLAKREQQKGMALEGVQCIKDKAQVVQFFRSFPRVSLAMALSLATGFRNIVEFLSSPVERIQQIGRMSSSRARDIVDFITASGAL